MHDYYFLAGLGMFLVLGFFAIRYGATFRGRVGWTGAEIEIGPGPEKKPPGA